LSSHQGFEWSGCFAAVIQIWINASGDARSRYASSITIVWVTFPLRVSYDVKLSERFDDCNVTRRGQAIANIASSSENKPAISIV